MNHCEPSMNHKNNITTLLLIIYIYGSQVHMLISIIIRLIE